MKKELKREIVDKIMDRAIEINNNCREECRDFRVMVSPKHKNTLILRWTTINMDDIDKPVQCYHYECFNRDGSPQDCSINYTNQAEANAFFWSLETLYKQEFAIDHKRIK